MPTVPRTAASRHGWMIGKRRNCQRQSMRRLDSTESESAMKTITQNELAALKLVATYTGGSFNLWTMTGRSKASCRSHIMSVLTGEKTPQSKSGINALESALFAAVDAAGN